jgi:glucosamine--fructose-6-phosphate aminotransferase (isomerizing)
MLKEIHEQPRVLRNLLEKHHALAGKLDPANLGLSADYFRKLNRIMIVSCGTAYHAGMYGRLLLEHYTGLAVETDLASEFRYRDPKIDPGTLIIPVSQSGETADTLASIRMARSVGLQAPWPYATWPAARWCARATRWCSRRPARKSGWPPPRPTPRSRWPSPCWPCLWHALARRPWSEADVAARLKDLCAMPGRHPPRAGPQGSHQGHRGEASRRPSSLYLGRKFNYPTALEGALKNKEISYQHAEGFAAGEMKHGPIALINEYLPVVCICTQTRDEVREDDLQHEGGRGPPRAHHRRGHRRRRPRGDFAEDVIYVPDTAD